MTNTITPMIINNAFVLRVNFSRGSVTYIPYDYDRIIQCLAKWKWVHDNNDNAQDVSIPTEIEIGYIEQLLRSALPCIRKYIPEQLKKEIRNLT